MSLVLFLRPPRPLRRAREVDAFRSRALAVGDCRVFLAFADLVRKRPAVLRDAARGFFFGYRLRLGFATFVPPEQM